VAVSTAGHRFCDWVGTSEGIAPAPVAHRIKNASTVSLNHSGLRPPGRLNQGGTDAGLRTIDVERVDSVNPSNSATSRLFKICTIYSSVRCNEFREFL
jgi:hypothetical protein